MVGKIIKSGEAAGGISAEPSSLPRVPAASSKGVLRAEEYEARNTAQDILAQAEAQAAQLRARAQQERERVLAEAREEGRQQGLAQMAEVIAKAKLDFGDQLKKAEPEIVRLAIKVAERIIGAELQTSDETILNIVAKAVDQLRQSRDMVLRVNPADAEILRREKRKLLELIGRLKDIGFKEDPKVPRGGCVIETENGVVDAQLATQIDMLQNALLGEGE